VFSADKIRVYYYCENTMQESMLREQQRDLQRIVKTFTVIHFPKERRKAIWTSMSKA